MSVLIKGMEMPKDDEEIRLRIDAKGEVYIYGAYPTQLYEAIELPPHGDLIDKNNYEVFSYTGTEGRPNTFDDGIMYMLERLDAAPTIIEAEVTP